MEFKIPLSAEELRLAADCASMVQNHVTLVSMTQTDNGMDTKHLADSDHCDCSQGGKVEITILPCGWLDAPTCEGWWWYQPAGSDLEVVQVAARRASRGQCFAVLRAGCEAGLWGMDADVLSELPAGRWFGPLVPPS